MNFSSPHPAQGLAAYAASPRRRQAGLQPPSLLTTSIENARNASLGVGPAQPTPSSTTTLSSPFSAPSSSAHSSSAYPQSAVGAMSAVSPMTLRHTSSHPSQYNPQQWAPINNASPQSAVQPSRTQRVVALAPQPVGPDEPVASPPPPYSPRRENDTETSPQDTQYAVSTSNNRSPEIESYRHATPLNSAHTVSPDRPSTTSPFPARAQPSYQSTSASASPSTAATSTFAAPPHTQNSAAHLRSSSREHAGRLLSSLTSRNRNNNTSPVNAIDNLHVNTNYALEQSRPSIESPTSRAPAARRAASTGDISLDRGSTPVLTQSPAWEPGMPLPPPPPGPPPSAARTQSLNRPIESPALERGPTLPLRTRRPPGQGTALETVPPTPADWLDEAANNEQHTTDRSTGVSPLRIDTSNAVRQNHVGHDSVTASATVDRRRDSLYGGLVRTPAVRNRSSTGLWERRSESKHGKERAVEADNNSGGSSMIDNLNGVTPSDLDLARQDSSNPNRRRMGKRTPNSGGILQDTHSVSRSNHSSPFGPSSSGQDPWPSDGSGHSSSPTPPASAKDHEPQTNKTALPGRRSLRLSQRLSLAIGLGSDQRPLSHILHAPNPEDALQVPLTPSGRLQERPTSDLLCPESPRAFAERCIERHRNFAQREAAASNDTERLELFIGFIIAESKIRREQYALAFEAENLDTSELANELFKPIPDDEGPAEAPQTDPPVVSNRPVSVASSNLADLSSPGGASTASRKLDSPSSATSASSVQPPLTGGLKDYQPCLSPIVSINTGPDEELNSRGRPPSRWWETPSHSESPANDGFSVLGRTKRESKYMGVPKEARDSVAVSFRNSEPAAREVAHRSARSPFPPSYSPDEYPPEKVGLHEREPALPPPPPRLPPTPSSAPITPDARGLDISRLVTLPPPYPRHHPAVNNSHPDLSDVRNVIRSLHEMDEPNQTRKTYQTEMTTKRKRADSWCEHQRSLHRQDIQYRMENEQMTQEQFDDLEAELEGKLQQSEKEITQTEFDLFQNRVVTPLHAFYAQRITSATSAIETLQSALFTAAQSHSPNLPQEEGDEQPELLEKLTQLKWLFEGRESLHRWTYDLLTERNDRYKKIVVLPYAQTNNQEKVAEAGKFFAQDTLNRRMVFDKDVSTRAHSFLSVIEHHVSRGVEMQLDAFWQIAPDLKQILQKVPQDLSGFEVGIPAGEYAENPSYYEHPLQYLWSLLSHADKATFQFIESQINLFCLLHEIRSCALIARCNVENNEGRMSNMEAYRQREDKRLHADLKDKVGVVEGQWGAAFGDELQAVRERVREKLLQDGGWDDDADEM